MTQRHFTTALFTALIAASALCFSAGAAEVHWYTTIEEASAAALKTNKPLLIEFWAAWCSACKVMEKEVYTDSAFIGAADLFLLVRIDFDKKTAISRKYNVIALPTLVFTDSYGENPGSIESEKARALLDSL